MCCGARKVESRLALAARGGQNGGGFVHTTEWINDVHRRSAPHHAMKTSEKISLYFILPGGLLAIALLVFFLARSKDSSDSSNNIPSATSNAESVSIDDADAEGKKTENPIAEVVANSALPKPVNPDGAAPVNFLVGDIDTLKGRDDAKSTDNFTIVDPKHVAYFAKGVDTINLLSTDGDLVWVIEEGQTLRFNSTAELDMFYNGTTSSWTEKPILGRTYVLKSLKFTLQ